MVQLWLQLASIQARPRESAAMRAPPVTCGDALLRTPPDTPGATCQSKGSSPYYDVVLDDLGASLVFTNVWPVPADSLAANRITVETPPAVSSNGHGVRSAQ